MNSPGASEAILVQTRAALLDAIEALSAHATQLVVIGAQAIHLRTGEATVALAPSTKDADLALDPRGLNDDPLMEDALNAAGFSMEGENPGQWCSPSGIPVDLMLPAYLARVSAKRRSVRIPPHSNRVARNTHGIEGCVIDFDEYLVSALDPADPRQYAVKVAGPGGLLVSKTIKIGERLATPQRLTDKDAHDVYRLLVGTETADLGARVRLLGRSEISAEVTREGMDHLQTLFANGPDAPGSMMAGRAEEGIGEPATVAAAVSALASDLLDELGK